MQLLQKQFHKPCHAYKIQLFSKIFLKSFCLIFLFQHPSCLLLQQLAVCTLHLCQCKDCWLGWHHIRACSCPPASRLRSGLVVSKLPDQNWEGFFFNCSGSHQQQRLNSQPHKPGLFGQQTPRRSHRCSLCQDRRWGGANKHSSC